MLGRHGFGCTQIYHPAMEFARGCMASGMKMYGCVDEWWLGLYSGSEETNCVIIVIIREGCSVIGSNCVRWGGLRFIWFVLRVTVFFKYCLEFVVFIVRVSLYPATCIIVDLFGSSFVFLSLVTSGRSFAFHLSSLFFVVFFWIWAVRDLELCVPL
jgi:hypothetical protein